MENPFQQFPQSKNIPCQPKYLYTIGAKPQQDQPSSQPGLFNRPSGLSSNQRGHIFVTDLNNHCVQIFDERSKVLRCFGCRQDQQHPYGRGGNDADQFQFPFDVSVDIYHTQLLFVADTFNRRLSVGVQMAHNILRIYNFHLNAMGYV